MDIDAYQLAAVLTLLLVAALAVGVRLIINALRIRRETSPAARRTAYPTASDYYARTLQQAAEVVGGEANLATALRAPPHALRRWLEGVESPPIQVHLAALDLITRRTGKPPKRRNARKPWDGPTPSQAPRVENSRKRRGYRIGRAS